MLQTVGRATVTVFVPVLAAISLAFEFCLLTIKSLVGLFGLEIVWPPVLVDEAEAVADEQARQ